MAAHVLQPGKRVGHKLYNLVDCSNTDEPVCIFMPIGYKVANHLCQVCQSDLRGVSPHMLDDCARFQNTFWFAYPVPSEKGILFSGPMALANDLARMPSRLSEKSSNTSIDASE